MGVKKSVLLVFLFFLSVGIGQENDTLLNTPEPIDSFQSERFLDMMETSLLSFYKETKQNPAVDSLFLSFDYGVDSVPLFSDSVYCARLDELNAKSPFQLECNADVLRTIDFFARKRRKFTSVVLGRSQLYFDLFEEKLAKHDMPIELKYLSVIESGLRPQVKSRAGALGLWQFMYRTGKMYGLDQDSYIDQRMDPELSTEAACLYLKKLHSMYDDWNMALAAYNAGPGNVNKAIRRSGGKMTYWEIRPYLPRETQGYVPNFIAMSYMMSYHVYHNIPPAPPLLYDFEIDTVCLKQSLHMQTLDSMLGWSEEDIQRVNPIYKTSYIPFYKDRKNCINIPVTYVKDWIALEDSIYQRDSILFNIFPNTEVKADETAPNATIHTVRSGESLSVIGRKYGVTVNQLKDWNNLRSTNLRIGQKLSVYGSSASTRPQKVHRVANQDEHTVESGDNYWKIANQYGTTVAELQRLNPQLDPNDLKVGQVIKLRD